MGVGKRGSGLGGWRGYNYWIVVWIKPGVGVEGERDRQTDRETQRQRQTEREIETER